MRKLCRDLGTQGVQVLWEIANDKDEKGQARVQAISVLLERGYGKAVQPVEIGAPGAFDDMTDAELDALAQNTARKVIDLTVVTDEDPE
jgi:hypothetical protein